MLLSFEDNNNIDCESDELLLPNYDDAFANYDESFYLKDPFSTATDALPQTPVFQSIEFDEDLSEVSESSDFLLDDLGFQPLSKDDTCISAKPSQNIDYLSHKWDANDFWASRKLVLTGEFEDLPRCRLENTLWRTWAKSFHKLPIATPESVQW